jgi:hypothetical protein
MIHALQNEVAIDKKVMDVFYKDTHNCIPIIRPFLVFKKITNPYILKFLFYFLIVLWPIIFPFSILVKFFTYITKIKSPNNVKFKKNIIIATSRRMETLVDGISDNIPSQWLVVPWLNIIKIDFKNKYTKIDMMSLVTFLDLVRTLKLSLGGLIVWIKYIKHPLELLQSYVLFEYFLMALVLNKLNKSKIEEYWYANHYDRWSVLIDNTENNNVLIQHGLLNPDFILPYKLRNIKQLYFINESSRDIFFENIINYNKNIYSKKLNNTLLLQTINNNKNCIFIISSPAQLSFDKKIINLLSNYEITIYIKPHPISDLNEYIQALSNYNACHVIEKNDFYPDIDIIVSGYSTLAVEYQYYNKSIIWINQQTEIELNKIIKKIKEITKNV